MENVCGVQGTTIQPRASLTGPMRSFFSAWKMAQQTDHARKPGRSDPDITDDILAVSDDMLIAVKKLYAMADGGFGAAEEVIQIPHHWRTVAAERFKAEAQRLAANEQVSMCREQLYLAGNRLALAEDKVTLIQDQLRLARSQVMLAKERLVFVKEQLASAEEEAEEQAEKEAAVEA